MSRNLLQALWHNLGYPSLCMENAGIWQVTNNELKFQDELFSQASLPTIFAALYKYSRSSKGAESLLYANLSSDWTSLLLGDHKMEIILKIAVYSNLTKDEVNKKVTAITEEAIRVLRQQVTKFGTNEDVKNTLADTLDEVLLHLPNHMEIEEFLIIRPVIFHVSESQEPDPISGINSEHYSHLGETEKINPDQ